MLECGVVNITLFCEVCGKIPWNATYLIHRVLHETLAACGHTTTNKSQLKLTEFVGIITCGVVICVLVVLTRSCDIKRRVTQSTNFPKVDFETVSEVGLPTCTTASFFC